MKKNIFIFLFLFFLLISGFYFFSKINTNENPSTILDVKYDESGETLTKQYKNIVNNNTGSKSEKYKLSGNNSFSGTQDFHNKQPNLESTLNFLLSEKEIINLLKKEKNGNFLEEIPRIQSYSSNQPFYEYYILLSFKDNSILPCAKLDGKERKLCENLFNETKNKDDFVRIYLNFGERLNFALKMYDAYVSLSKGKKCNGILNISIYLACKKTLDLSFDADLYFRKYSILEISSDKSVNPNYGKVNRSFYSEVIEHWGLDNDFNLLFEN